VIREGDKAPDFSLVSDAGKTVSLQDFKGKTLVLYFYPKDDTPGCTREAQAFSVARAKIEKLGGAVVGVSRDSTAAHCKFKDKYGLSIPLLSDPERKAHEAYGAWGEKTMYGKKITGAIRSTFVIKDGKVVKAYPSVKVDGHADAILELLGGGRGASSPRPSAAKPAKAAPKKKAAAKPAKKKAAAKKKK
jgi:peroxiredoxin Q/BCP